MQAGTTLRTAQQRRTRLCRTAATLRCALLYTAPRFSALRVIGIGDSRQRSRDEQRDGYENPENSFHLDLDLARRAHSL